MKQRLLLAFFWMLTCCLGLLPAARAETCLTPSPGGLADNTLVVYPNPSTGIVYLTISGLEGRKVELSVLNVIGTVMYHETLSELNERYTKTLDLSRLSNGLYYVKLEADNSSQLCKLVIH